MTDIEITQLCAKAMRIRVVRNADKWELMDDSPPVKFYDPLNDDAQAMTLLKKFTLWVGGWTGAGIVCVSMEGKYLCIDSNLNRAICECVANMQENI